MKKIKIYNSSEGDVINIYEISENEYFFIIYYGDDKVHESTKIYSKDEYLKEIEKISKKVDLTEEKINEAKDE